MGVGVRPLMARVSRAYDEAGRVPVTWITAIFAMVLLAAFTTEEIGIALIFGGFIAGTVMPRHAGLTEDVTHRIEDFVVLLLLPLFFAYTGLKTNVAAARPRRARRAHARCCSWWPSRASSAARCVALARRRACGWRESAVIGALMNTRGLTELIVLNLALEKGVISEALFAALVLMALVTTFMAGPVLDRLDPTNEFGEPVEAELERARAETAAITPMPIPEQSILVAPQTEAALAQLLAVAEPLATSEPPRELIIARAHRAAARRGGARRPADRALPARRRGREHDRVRGRAARRAACRRARWRSRRPTPGRDLAKLADREDVDLVLRRRPPPAARRGRPARRRSARSCAGRPATSPCSSRARTRWSRRAPTRRWSCPFGGAEHDWAALELGAWLAASTGAPLRLLGATGDGEGSDAEPPARRPRRCSCSASSGSRPSRCWPSPVATGSCEAAAGAGLLVVGLSDRWREEGLGSVRHEIAAAAPAPILFVRRGLRPGALAPRTDVTRFTWSHVGAGMP